MPAQLVQQFSDDSSAAKQNRQNRSGQIADRKLSRALSQRHPWWVKMRPFWQKIIDFMEVANMEIYIHRHARESLKSWQQRARRIAVREYVPAILSLYIHYIFSKTINRSPMPAALEDAIRRAKDGPQDEQGNPTDIVEIQQWLQRHKWRPGQEQLNDEWKEFLNNVDRDGTPIDRYIATQGELALGYGKMYIVVDMPRAQEKPLNEARRRELGLRPYLSAYSPLDAVDWELDNDGKLEWIRFIEPATPDKGPFEQNDDKLSVVMGADPAAGGYIPARPTSASNQPTPSQQKEGNPWTGAIQYRTWTRDAWYLHKVESDQIELVDSGKHGLGEVPVVSMYNKKGLRFTFGGLSLVAGIITLAQEILNLDSLITESLFQQTLSILVMGRQQIEGDEIIISESNVLEVSPNGFPPYFLTPSQAPVQFMEQRIQVLAQEIYRLSKFGGGFGLEPKAVAPTTAAYEFNLTNRALADRAANFEAAEKEIHRLWYKWMNSEWQGYVEYPDNFSIESFAESLQVLTAAKAAVRSPTFKRELEKKEARRILDSHDESVIKRVEAEIDVIEDQIDGFTGPLWYDPITQTVNNPGAMQQPGMAGPEGQPAGPGEQAVQGAEKAEPSSGDNGGGNARERRKQRRQGKGSNGGSSPKASS